MLEPVIVTDSIFAKARPARLEPVKVIFDPASTFPTKSVLLNVAAVPSRQYTLHACPPLAMTTLLLVSGVAPPMGVMEDAPLKIQTPFAGPASVKGPKSFDKSPTPLIQ